MVSLNSEEFVDTVGLFLFLGSVQTMSRDEIYILKHKDLDAAMVKINPFSGRIEYVLEVYMPEELPAGCAEDGTGLAEWWNMRAVPDTRKGIQQQLKLLGEETGQSLMLAAYGLSLTDHYWMQPISRELYWKDINFFENDFSDELGNLLTDTGKIDIDGHISCFSPASSVNGEMKKKWVIRNQTRYLMKINTNNYEQQAVNETIACRLHERLGWQNYIPYEIEMIRINGEELPCCLTPSFTSPDTELVSAYQLIKNYKIPNDQSEYEAIIHVAAQNGMEEGQVRAQLEYMILTDFILSNTDRHYNNFGFLYSSQEHRLIKMAPAYDTGNCLFYDKDFIPVNSDLLNIRVNSFCKKETDMLTYVKNKECIDLSKLDGFPEEVKTLLLSYTKMPEERTDKLVETVEKKISYLKLFQSGKKIWKREKYW